MNKEVRTKLSPPWITWLSEIEQMFGQDPDIKISYDDYTIKLYVANAEKAAALDCVLPCAREFGNVIMYLKVVPPNEENKTFDKNDGASIYETIFKNNPVLSFIRKVEGPFTFNATYVVFKNKVVQYFNDNLNDIYGNTSTLYEDIARDIFVDYTREITVFFCTDVADNKLKKPLGEWP